MKAFISYSLNSDEEYIVTLLSYQLRLNGFELIMSNNPDEFPIDYTVRNQIFVAQLFVGIITYHSSRSYNVTKEYEIAKSFNIPAILLVEDSVPISYGPVSNCISFNRNTPEKAIEDIKKRIANTKLTTVNSNNNDSLGWILGGAAILAVVALLTGDFSPKKRRKKRFK